MKREWPERYVQGLRAGIAARTAGGRGEEAPPQPLPDAFDLPSKLAGCAAEDRAPDAEERLSFAQHGFRYLGPEKDGFLVGIPLPDGLIAARQLLALASLCQQFADGSVEYDPQGWLGLQVVSVCDAPEVLRQIESAGLKAAPEPRVESSATRKRLLSSEMTSLAERIKTRGAIDIGSALRG